MDEQSNSLIEILDQKKASVKEDRNVLANIIISIQNILERYYNSENAFVKQITLLHKYVSTLQNNKKDQFPIVTRCNTKDIAADLTALIDAIKDEITTIGLPLSSKGLESKGIQITNNVNQSQNQEQNVIMDILLEAVKDELNGKRRKELLAIARSAKDPQEAHKSIMEKLKEYGDSVTASIVANILTNPNVWNSLGSLL